MGRGGNPNFDQLTEGVEKIYYSLNESPHYSSEYKRKIYNLNIKNTNNCGNPNLLIPDDEIVVADSGVLNNELKIESKDVAEIEVSDHKYLEKMIRDPKKILKDFVVMGYKSSFYCTGEGVCVDDANSIKNQEDDCWLAVRKGPTSLQKNIGDTNTSSNPQDI